MADRTAIRIAPLLVGLSTIVLGILLVLLPSRDPLNGLVIGTWLIVAAGALDLATLSWFPRRFRLVPVALGSITIAAGLLALAAYTKGFFSVAMIILPWLVGRGIIQFTWANISTLPALSRRWLYFEAFANWLAAGLAFMPIVVVSIFTALFGQSETLVEYAIYPAIALILSGGARAASAFLYRDEDRS